MSSRIYYNIHFFFRDSEYLHAEHDRALYHRFSKRHNKSPTDFIGLRSVRKLNSGIFIEIKISQPRIDTFQAIYIILYDIEYNRITSWTKITKT